MEGEQGTYRVHWIHDGKSGIPVLKIEMDDAVILEKDMNEFLDHISEKYSSGTNLPAEAPLEDMSVELDTPNLSILVVMDNVEIHVNPTADKIDYWMSFKAIYMKENL